MNRSWFMLISLILFVIGSYILFNSITWGQEAANSYLRSQGGGMDGAQFMIVLQESINIYKWFGIILSLVSGLGIVRAIELK
jgi:hypothetical protein